MKRLTSFRGPNASPEATTLDRVVAASAASAESSFGLELVANSSPPEQAEDGHLVISKRGTGVPLWGIGFAIPVFVLLAVARRYGYVAPVPWWVILGELISTLAVMAAFTSKFPPGSGRAKPRLHMLLQIVLIGVIVYTLGWGSLLAIGFIFPATNIMSSDGSEYGPWAVGCIVSTVMAGEVLVGLGLVKSMVAEPTGHGLALLEIAGACAVVWILTYNQKERERVERSVIESEQRSRALVQNAFDVIMVVATDRTVRYVSPAFETVLGYSAADSIGMDARSLITDEDAAWFHDITGNGRSRAAARLSELRLRCRDGSWRWFEIMFTDLFEVPGINGWVANLRDITDRKHADAALSEAHQRFRSAFENAPIGMAMVDADGSILQTNAAYARILGREVDGLRGMNVHELTHPDDRDVSSAEMRRVLSSDSVGYRIEKRYVHVDGHSVWASVNVSCVRDDDGKPLYLLGQIEDITERRELRERLAHAAIHDPLTDLPNRVLFMDRLETAINRALRHGRKVAVIYLDLDRFKLVNDGMGHAAGDRLLEFVADRLRTAVRPSDTVARFGGDEFVVLCEEISDRAVAVEVAERLIEVLGHPVLLAEGEIFVTASLGLAISGNHGDSAASLLRDADTAMYLAKERGRSRIEIFNQQSHVEAFEQMSMRNELHRALERDEFRLHYQPIAELASGDVVAVEALVRWEHPTRGLLGPNHFIPLAEDCGLIAPLGVWVLEEACAQAARWHHTAGACGKKPVEVNVNVSPRQLTSPDFVDSVATAIMTSGISASALCLEITESTLMGDKGTSAETLRNLKALGVQISIDDFGTGYSSLSYLKRFPIDSLKVDRTFVDGLGEEPDDSVIASAVIALAHSLELIAVAEGVETEIALEELRRLGCDRVQGFLLGYPQPAEDLHAVIFESHLLDPRITIVPSDSHARLPA